MSGGGLDCGGLDCGGLDGGLELLPTLMSRTTVTVMSPGFTVSVQPTHRLMSSDAAAGWRPSSRLPMGLSVTVALSPGASVPAVGETVTLPIRPDDSAIDQLTGPSEARKVSVPPFRPTTIVVGVTVRMPRLGEELADGDAEVAVLVDGAGELGFALDAGAGLVGDGCPL